MVHILRNQLVQMDKDNTMRYEGIREYAKVKQELKDTIEELLIMVKNDSLLSASIVYKEFPVSEVQKDHIKIKGYLRPLYGTIFSEFLAGINSVVLAVCTIGNKIEKRASEYFTEHKPLRGLILDNIGSAAVDEVVLDTCRKIMHSLRHKGLKASSYFNPGMPGFPLSEQRYIFELLPADRIGVSLTSGNVMVPRKSLSIAIGIGAEIENWSQYEICSHCNMSETCKYRKIN